MSLDGSESPASAPSPSPSSSSDDFAALLDAELHADRHLLPDVLEGDASGSPELDNGGRSSDLEDSKEKGSAEESSEEGSEEEEEESDVDILNDQEEHVNVESDNDLLEELR